MATVLKASNKNGQRVLATASRNIGYYLSDVYGNCSNAKAHAWADCFDKFQNTEDSSNFHICSKNSNFFTVAWNGTHGNSKAVFVETHANSYIVLLDK